MKIIGKVILALVLAVSIVSPTPPKAQAQLGGNGGTNCGQQLRQCQTWCNAVFGWPGAAAELARCYQQCRTEFQWCLLSGGN